MEVKELGYKQSIEWIMKRHYSSRKPNIMHSYCAIENDIIVGVVTFGKPASNSLCIGVCGSEYKDNVIELNRLCCDGISSLSKFLSTVLRLMKEYNYIIVSYADSQMNHNGYIYQATNFIYTGMTKERTDKFVEDGKHSRHYKNEKQSNKRIFRSGKHRYIYFCANKYKRKEYMSNLKYKIHPYPKGDNKYYEFGYKLSPIIIESNLNTQ